MIKKQKPVPGDIVKVKIDESMHTYARILNYTDFAFYDALTSEDIKAVEEIVSKPILFKAIVNDRGVEDGLWPIIGNVPLEDSLMNSTYYLPDIVDPSHFRIRENVKIREASREECVGLEVGVIWDPIHIEQRLKDHYEGNENIGLKTLDILENYKLGRD
ncbi:immunity protein 26 of polymorphic toxin system [Anseongella ginsenosidimutans]|uniref:Immunity protein 26 of polymorphic toxin system n=1 Tax=Anseongella ginsenosidimutans TaxID=496056 RepID=A0A4R3KIM1_9SPHI|nr:Imm26 family immunity protein [Anseongella ginsenosidimutans]QEC53035.1 hypothetical protein FRZ59_12290 [Anseongella ginsenosidimutans]TCS83444.1 immunity protein 26 of polymorphic toxin system [Anseongella ginsenosidimutans]